LLLKGKISQAIVAFYEGRAIAIYQFVLKRQKERLKRDGRRFQAAQYMKLGGFAQPPQYSRGKSLFFGDVTL
jgi:hypothetical protein